MTRFSTVLLAAATFAGVGLATDVGRSEDRFKAKYGRYTPAQERRAEAEAASTAYRVAPTSDAAPRIGWADRYKAKFGRRTPAEEARIAAERASTAFREDTSFDLDSHIRSLNRERIKAKYGRELGTR